MQPEIIGISGSPVHNSNTDRMISAILEATGRKSEFVKLSQMIVRPCMACKKCVSDNVCKVDDDFPALAEKIKGAGALVIGGYAPYGQIDGFTKAILERFWSLRHVNNLLKGKVCATVLTGLDPRILDQVNQALATELREYENMELVGQLTVQGNVPCVTCGRGDDCQMSGLKLLYGPDARAKEIGYVRVEDQHQVWEEAARLGRLIGESLNSKQR